jgi:propionate CoA-transferase
MKRHLRPVELTADEAAALITDDQTLAIGGAGAGHNVPDRLLQALGERFAHTGTPRNLTTFHPCGVGDNARRGLNHIAQKGLIRCDIGGFWGNAPSMVALAKAGDITGYNLPQGVLSHLCRAIASGKPGLLTTTGLHTFVDPRLEGGRINPQTTTQLVEVVPVRGQEHLFYPAFPVDVALIRGTAMDAEGNLIMDDEVGSFAMLSLAQAARRGRGNGQRGLVIAQVKRIERDVNYLPARVRIPAVWIDYVVVEPTQSMTFLSDLEPALVSRTATYTEESLDLSGIRRVIARRAALELRPGTFVNLGYGLPDGVPIVARQEGILDQLSFMIEQGSIAGVPTTGLNFGAMFNPLAIIDDGYQFDFFQGGGLDICFLGFAQIDRHGNVNASRFGNVLTGCGGFIDISQNTRHVVFCGGFAAKAEAEGANGMLHLHRRGSIHKFIDTVEQVTFSGDYARQRGQTVLYVTERAVFELLPDGLTLTEIAPGVDLQTDVLDLMDFTPRLAPDLKRMDSRLFTDVLLGLKAQFDKTGTQQPTYPVTAL